MPDDGEVVAVRVQQHRVVRRRHAVLVPAHERRPGFAAMIRRNSATSVIAKLGF
jgi:hypothetical protein